MTQFETEQSISRPDWVMLGTPGPDGWVYLFASTELTQAELQTRVEDPSSLGAASDRACLSPDVVYTIVAEMPRFVMVLARDYVQAFEFLWKKWQPEDRRAGAVPSPLVSPRRLELE